jgi:hypothetical protein
MASHGLVDATRQQLQLAEALGYRTKDSYKPLYAQLDEIQKKAEAGQSGGRLFDRLRKLFEEFQILDLNKIAPDGWLLW